MYIKSHWQAATQEQVKNLLLTQHCGQSAFLQIINVSKKTSEKHSTKANKCLPLKCKNGGNQCYFDDKGYWCLATFVLRALVEV